MHDTSVLSRYFGMKDFENVLVCSTRKKKLYYLQQIYLKKKLFYFSMFIELDLVFSEQTEISFFNLLYIFLCS